ncbi:hypothetical protein KKA15_05320 [Patescibacteria group bacterium]|nr:hypothetical protein [Patescibacteria group bacterium]
MDETVDQKDLKKKKQKGVTTKLVGSVKIEITELGKGEDRKFFLRIISRSAQDKVFPKLLDIVGITDRAMIKDEKSDQTSGNEVEMNIVVSKLHNVIRERTEFGSKIKSIVLLLKQLSLSN